MIDLTLALRGAALMRTRRLAALLVLTVVAGLLAGLGGLAALTWGCRCLRISATESCQLTRALHPHREDQSPP